MEQVLKPQEKVLKSAPKTALQVYKEKGLAQVKQALKEISKGVFLF